MTVLGLGVTLPASAAPDDAPARSTTVSVTSASAEDGLVLDVEGAGYTATAPGVYAAVLPAISDDLSGLLAQAWIGAPSSRGSTVNMSEDGAWSVPLTIPVENLTEGVSDYRVIVWPAHTNPTEETLLDSKTFTLTIGQLAGLFGTPQTAASVTGASADAGLVLDVQGAGYTGLSGTAAMFGVYAAVLPASDEDFSDLLAQAWIGTADSDRETKISVDGSWGVTLVAEVADLASSVSDYRVIVWPAHTNPTEEALLGSKIVTLTSEQLIALFGVDDSTPTETTTVTTSPTTSTPTTTAPTTSSPTTSTPPTTTPSAPKPTASLIVGTDGAKTDTAAIGQKVTFVASGFTPGEKVSATVHSDPINLGSVTANAQGEASFTWTVPAGFATGAHRIVLQAASGTVELPFTVAPPAIQCTTETIPATPGTPHLNWGVKSSFVSYVESSIANGSITTGGGAARAGDSFTWGTGSGKLTDGSGTLSFPGSVHFSGHDGVLNVTLSNLKVVVSGGSTGTLVADAQSSDMEGNEYSSTDITFANLAFSSLSATGGTASATLTADGANAFAGFYNPGDALDSLTVSITGAKAASTVQKCTDAAGNEVDADGNPIDGLPETGFPTGSMAGLAAGLAAAGVLLLLVARRRQSAVRAH